MASRAEMITKLQNLLKKTTANGATESEAHSALLMAQKLMLRHGIEEDDLIERKAVHGDLEAIIKKKETYRKPVTDYGTPHWWYGQLGVIISKNFRCYCWWESPMGHGDKGQRLVFLGLKDDTVIAASAFDFAVRSILFLSEAYLDEREVKGRSKRNAIRNDYMVGYIKGLEDRFDKQVKENNFQIVLVKDIMVQNEYGIVKKEFGLKSKARSTISSRGDQDAKRRGYQDGKNFNFGVGKLK